MRFNVFFYIEIEAKKKPDVKSGFTILNIYYFTSKLALFSKHLSSICRRFVYNCIFFGYPLKDNLEPSTPEETKDS